MAKQHPTPQQLARIRELASEWGKIVVRRFGPDEIANLDFAAMEQIALAAAAGLTESTIGTLMDQRVATLAAEHPCPACGKLCPIRHQDRNLTVKGGTEVPLHEPLGHCPDCRRDFFPPAARSGPG